VQGVRRLSCPHPHPLSHCVGEGCRGARQCALLTPIPPPDKGTSLGFAVGRGRPLFALTPSPSPTLWERGVGARGSAPCSAFPLSRLAGEGDKGGEGNTARLPVHACAGKNSPCCRDSVPSRCTLVSIPPPCVGEGRRGARQCALRFPLARLRERGTQGVRAVSNRLPHENRRAPPSEGSKRQDCD
jgi:hypothetical protein